MLQWVSKTIIWILFSMFVCLFVTGNGSISDSMWSSLTSSIMLAQECLKQDPTEGEQEAGSSQPFEGPELLAQTIESGELSNKYLE